MLIGILYAFFQIFETQFSIHVYLFLRRYTKLLIFFNNFSNYLFEIFSINYYFTVTHYVKLSFQEHSPHLQMMKKTTTTNYDVSCVTKILPIQISKYNHSPLFVTKGSYCYAKAKKWTKNFLVTIKVKSRFYGDKFIGDEE